MPGARIVLNSRYFHIANAGEKADGKHCMTKDAAMGLVNYVGTRESVVFNQLSMYGESVTSLNLEPLNLKSEVASRPATHKQIDLLADLLHEFPQAKDSHEYADFKENPTIENASELISHAAEFGLGFAVDLGKAKNLVEYVGKRPGVDRVGEHGLFSSSPEVDIKKAQEEIANCKGNIWTHVISLRREDADALGYDTQKPWRDLILQKIDVIAKASNIPVSELHWYAGMHNTTHHPHIHLFIFSDNPKSGRLTKDGINKMKSEFSEVIFADERHHIYEHKDEMREGIKHQVDKILSGIESNSANQFTKKEMNALCDKLLRLGDVLKERPGKLQYGWIKDLDIKRQIKDIMADLAKVPAIQELYRLYCEDHKELQSMYRNNPNDIGPIENQKEFQSIRNKIIREAVNLARTQSDLGYNSETSEEPTSLSAPRTATNEYSEEYVDSNDASSLLSEEESLFASILDEKPEYDPPDGFDQPAAWDSQDDFEPPYETDRKASADHNKTEDTFQDCFSKAMAGDTKSRYELAKRYFYGNGVEQDYGQAMVWYGLAAKTGHSFAKYELGKMYLYGIGIEKDLQLGKEYCFDAYWDFRSSVEQVYGFDIGRYVDDGTVFEEGHSGIKDAAYLMYCLGRMEYAGEGVDRDYGKAFRWYQLAAEGEHVHSNYCMAKMYYGGEGVQQDYSKALQCYKAAADGKDKYAYYALGKMYDTGTGVEQNYSLAADWFTMASRENVPYADYRLAQMYEAGQGVAQDAELSGILYRKALEEFQKQEKQQPNASDEFRIANMYLRRLGVEVNPEEAAKWLQLCIEKEDPRAQYQLAGMYQTGQGVEPNEEKAQELYANSLSGFLQLEQETPSAHVEYKIACMYDRGIGTEQDNGQAFTWYSKAADNGHPHAAYRVAKAYFDGTGVDPDYGKAIEWYKTAADGKDPYALYSLGKMFRAGIGTEQDLTKAYQYFLAAVKLEHEFAQFAVAKALLHGEGIEKNVPRAMKWFEKCITHGNHFAEYDLAEILHNEKDASKDEARAQKYYAAALAGFLQIDQEKPDAQLEYRIGSMFQNGKGTKSSPSEAFRWFEQSADHGNAYAAYQAATILHEGKAVSQDEAQAQKYYATALAGFLLIEKEKPDAQLEYRIGSMYLQGAGIEKNPAEALRYFTKSAVGENAFAAYQAARLCEESLQPDSFIKSQYFYRLALNGFLIMGQETHNDSIEYRIGQMLFSGKGCAVDKSAAFQWLYRSAEHNNSYAQFQVARMLQSGDGIPKDEIRAGEFYARALQGFLKLNQEEPDAGLQYKIATIFEFGLGVSRDITAAKQWYRISADFGNEYAAERLNQISEMETNMAVGSILSLFRAFGRSLGENVMDSTTRKYRQDRKLMQKQHELKVERGHKYDDQEQVM